MLGDINVLAVSITRSVMAAIASISETVLRFFDSDLCYYHKMYKLLSLL